LMERIRHALGVFAIVVYAPGLLYQGDPERVALHWLRNAPRLIPRR